MTSENSRTSKETAEVFDSLQARFKGKIHFRKMDWGARDTEPIIEQFSLSEPPASVIADAGGKVVRKFEGAHDARKVEDTLKSLSK